MKMHRMMAVLVALILGACGGAQIVQLKSKLGSQERQLDQCKNESRSQREQLDRCAQTQQDRDQLREDLERTQAQLVDAQKQIELLKAHQSVVEKHLLQYQEFTTKLRAMIDPRKLKKAAILMEIGS